MRTSDAPQSVRPRLCDDLPPLTPSRPHSRIANSPAFPRIDTGLYGFPNLPTEKSWCGRRCSPPAIAADYAAPESSRGSFGILGTTGTDALTRSGHLSASRELEFPAPPLPAAE